MGILSSIFGAQQGQGSGQDILSILMGRGGGGAGGALSPGASLLDEIKRRGGATPGINPNESVPGMDANASGLPGLATQGNFGGAPAPTSNLSKKQVAAVQSSKDPMSLANLLLSKAGGVGQKLMPISNFLGKVSNSLEGSARAGHLGALAPNFQAGVQGADENALNKRLVEAQIAKLLAPNQLQRKVQSAQPLANGNIGYLDAFTGEVVDTGQRAGGKGQVFDLPGVGQVVYDPIQGTVTQINSEDVIQSGTEGRSAAGSRGTKIGQAEGDLEAQSLIDQKDAPRAIAAGNIHLGTLNDTIAKVRTLEENVSGFTTGIGGSLTKGIPGSPSFDFATLKTEVESFLALDKIKELKAQSATGATGLGAVNEREFDALQKAVANLDQAQSPDAMRNAIQRLDDVLSRIADTVETDIKKAQKLLGIELNDVGPKDSRSSVIRYDAEGNRVQ